MQIPKQPRTKSTTGESSPEGAAASQQGAASTSGDLGTDIQDAYAAYVKNVSSAHLQAQLDQAKAYLAYLESLQRQDAQFGSNPTLSYWQDLVRAGGDAQATADAQMKYTQASIDNQAAYQKALTEVPTAYSQSSRAIWETLQSQIAQHNQEIADSLKDALLKIDVSPANLPTLSLLYQGLRTMVATSAADTTSPA